MNLTYKIPKIQRSALHNSFLTFRLTSIISYYKLFSSDYSFRFKGLSHSDPKDGKELVLEQTPKYRTSNIPNIECPNIELSEHHILAQNRTSNMSNITKTQTVRKHQTVSSKTSLVT